MKFFLPSVILSIGLLASQVFANTNADYEKALSAYNDKKFDEAFIHLKNSLQADPNNLVAKILMGKLLLINGYLSAAEGEFLEAIEQGVDVNLVAEPLGNALLFQNKYQQVIDYDWGNELSLVQQVSWNRISASACIRTNKLDCAIEKYNNILVFIPDDVSALNGLASVALFRKNLDDAEKYIDTAFSISEQDATSWRLRGQLAMAREELDQAEVYLKRSLELNPSHPIALRRLVDIYLAENDFKQAKTLVSEIVERTPHDPLAILLDTWVKNRESDVLIQNEKFAQLRDIMTNIDPGMISQQPELLYIAGLTSFLEGKIETAIGSLEQYNTRVPDDLQAALLLTRAYMTSQQHRRALALLEKYKSDIADDVDTTLLLAELYIHQNKIFKAKAIVDKLLSDYPGDSRVQLFEIRVMAARGKLDEAVQILDKNFANNQNNANFLMAYSMLKLQAEQLVDALKGADGLLQLYPDEPEFLNLKGGILLRQGKLVEAKDTINKALSINSDLFSAKFNLATIYSKQGDIDNSLSLTEELLARVSNHAESLLLKAHNFALLGRTEQAQGIYRDILATDAKNAVAREKLAFLLRASREYEQALYHVERLLVDDFDNPKHLLLKADLKLRLGDKTNALTTLNIAKHFTENNIQYLLQEVRLYTELNDLDNALERIDFAVKLAPNNTRLQLEKAQLLTASGKHGQARNLLAQLSKSNRDNPNYWMISALLNVKLEKIPQAAADLQRALALDATFSRAIFTLFNIAIANQNVVDFASIAQSVIAKAPDFTVAKVLLARYHFLRREFDQATPVYLQLLDSDVKEGRAEIYNNLALMSIEDNLAQAKLYAQQALQIDEAFSGALDTYGWILAQEGAYEEGLGFLRKAYARDSENPEIFYHLGYTLAKLGRVEEAKLELRRASNTKRPFYNRKKAQKLLEEL